MLEYPKNRIYAIIPVKKAEFLIGDIVNIARKSLDQKYLVWDFPKNDKILTKLKKYPDVKLYSHSEILKIMSTKFWSRPLDSYNSTLKL